MSEQSDHIRRRAFIGRVARKAAYVAPTAIALTAVRRAQGGSGACLIQGSACEQDTNGCCTALTCQRGNLTACVQMGMAGTMCTCEP